MKPVSLTILDILNVRTLSAQSIGSQALFWC